MKNTKVHYKDYLYIAPAVVLVAIFFIYSIIFTTYVSFFDWGGFGEMEYVGLGNYIQLFDNSNFLVALGNTFVWVFSSLITAFFIPLILAIMIVNSSNTTLFKNLLFFPNAISVTIVGLLMSILLSISGMPQAFGFLGLDHLVKNWLAIPYVNTMVMIVVGMWQGVGLYLLLFIVGLLSIDKSVIEAAKIDGAKKIKLYTKIVIPELKNTIQIVILMAIINSFKVFDNIWIMTKGGPFRSSETLALTMYFESFNNGKIGYGAAIAVLLSLVMLFVSYFYLRKSFSEDGA